ncbi:hypothetical protein AQUCO_01800089v1 [Aquilegia coerulea]|uniref:DNA-binding protein BIN4 n=1 Tax=Aquilegia coerulea TaxID=218851 RepID=A0A2G5DJV0_AQUCA|nr:hypothetical protein AQUCO_01800089v1 [Aquilegia coerulea]
MSNSREGSPDWLRSYEAPKRSFLTLSSDSEPSATSSPIDEDEISYKEPAIRNIDQNQDTVLIDSDTDSPVSKPPKSKSLKSKVKTETQKRKRGDGVKGEDVMEAILEKPVEPQKRKGSGVKQEDVKEEILEKTSEPHVSSRLPLVISEKVHRSKALVECEGESIDMSGDVGAVGRVVITDAQSGDPEMLLDLKGTIYKTTVIPSRTFCVVSFNQAEAKIEAVMNDFIQLKPISNVYEAETMIEGTLDGFSYDSEEETNRIQKPNARQSDQNNEGDELTNGKTNKGVTRRKVKPAAKPPKKGTNKTQGPKKAKNAKK